MNTFKKYPKLNLLFFLRISIIVLAGLVAYYFISNIQDAFDNIELQLDIKINANTSPNELQDNLKKQVNFYESKNDILNNFYYLLLGILLSIKLLSFIKDKTDKENKRLDNIENNSNLDYS